MMAADKFSTSINLNGVDLDQVCPTCRGRDNTCQDCNGLGYQLTEAGQSMIKFVRRYIALTAQTEVEFLTPSRRQGDGVRPIA